MVFCENGNKPVCIKSRHEYVQKKLKYSGQRLSGGGRLTAAERMERRDG